jgi:hypothetical protein
MTSEAYTVVYEITASAVTVDVRAVLVTVVVVKSETVDVALRVLVSMPRKDEQNGTAEKY